MPKQQQIINTSGQPAMFDFAFDSPVARLVIKAYDADRPEQVYYLRYIYKPEQHVNIRFPVTPNNLAIDFVSDNPFTIDHTSKSELTPRNFDVEYERVPDVKRGYAFKDVKIEYVDDLGPTPAKMVVSGPGAPIMYVSKKAKACIPQQQMAMVINHEYQHVDFDDEEKTDEAAFYEFMKQGYNISQAYFALVNILGRRQENVKRMIQMFKLCKNFNENYN